MTPESSSRARGFEITDASVRAILRAVLFIGLGTAAAMGVVRLMMLGPRNAPAAFGVASPAGSFTHGPEEKSSIDQSWGSLDQELAETMGGYGWIDRPQGIVRLPIERAMDLIAAENGGEP